jgi:hypothetical protein
MLLKKSSPICALLAICLSLNAYAIDLSQTIPIRANITSCKAILSPGSKYMRDLKSEELGSVGIPLSDGTIDGLRGALGEIIAQGSGDIINGSELFITGISTAKESETKIQFEMLLHEHGYAPDSVKVRVLSIPPKVIKEFSLNAAVAALQRLAYFFPSIKRDYQTPLRSEFALGVATDAVVETPNGIFLWSTLPHLDAGLTLVTHATLLGALSIFNKTLVNWLLRAPQTKIEGFIKQASFSSVFIANYNLFGNFSTIVRYYQEHGWQQTLARFPYELSHFAATQGLTAFLQTLFYNIVITNGIQKWANNQSDPLKNANARRLAFVLKFPLLMLDSMALASASSGHNAFFSMGPVDLTLGHVALATLTAVGSVISFKPELLDPTLDWYMKLKELWKSRKSQTPPSVN